MTQEDKEQSLKEATADEIIEKASEWLRSRFMGFLGEGLTDKLLEEFKDFMNSN